MAGTFEDVAAGIDYLAELKDQSVDIDLTRVAVVGHSAGGQLALWSASAQAVRRVRPKAVAGLAAVVDLEKVHALDPNASVPAELLGGPPETCLSRYRAFSPHALLPLGVPQLIMHGARDESLAPALSQAYAQSAQALGDIVEYVELAEADHMVYLDPLSDAHFVLCCWLSGMV